MHVHSRSNRTVQMIFKNKVIYVFLTKKESNERTRFTAVEVK